MLIDSERVNFVFMSPYLVAQQENTNVYTQSKDIKEFFSKRASKKTLFLAPVNTGYNFIRIYYLLIPFYAFRQYYAYTLHNFLKFCRNHWVLIVINPTAQIGPMIHYLDSRHGKLLDQRNLLYVFNK